MAREEIADCDTCRFLLHYEWDKTEGKHSLPRCSIGFRDGRKVISPCSDYLKAVAKIQGDMLKYCAGHVALEELIKEE